jgi:hypothetical protein
MVDVSLELRELPNRKKGTVCFWQAALEDTSQVGLLDFKKIKKLCANNNNNITHYCVHLT